MKTQPSQVLVRLTNKKARTKNKFGASFLKLAPLYVARAGLGLRLLLITSFCSHLRSELRSGGILLTASTRFWHEISGTSIIQPCLPISSEIRSCRRFPGARSWAHRQLCSVYPSVQESAPGEQLCPLRQNPAPLYAANASLCLSEVSAASMTPLCSQSFSGVRSNLVYLENFLHNL